MVTRRRGLGLLMTVAILLAAAPGTASGRGQSGGSSSTQHQSSSGGSATASNGDCTFYANPARFGVACGPAVTTVREVLTLGGVPLVHPDCWDEIIPVQKLHYYGYTQTTNGPPYYIHSCATGHWLDENSPHTQPGVEISQIIITIPIGSPVCDKPWQDRFPGTCVATLTHNQQTLVTDMETGGSIPSIALTTHPSTTVRTNVLTGFGDTAFDLNGNLVGQATPKYTVGGVTMWAVMDRYLIYPYGPGNNAAGNNCYDRAPIGHFPTTVTPGTCERCNGPTALDDSSTPASAPDACWWTYPKSSHLQQTNESYDFRAEADWTVWYDDGGGPTPLASFKKYDDLDLPVYDVQSVNVS